MQGVVSTGLAGEPLGPVAAVHPEGVAQKSSSPVRYFPTACSRDLGEQPAQVQALEKSAHRGTVPAGFLVAGGRLVQGRADVLVAEALGDVVAVQDCGKQLEVLSAGRVEAGVVAVVDFFGLGEP